MVRGGKREGAGRPKGTGKYEEETKAIRVPISLIDQVQKLAMIKGYSLPLYSSSVSAGFPSPADDHIEHKLDLNEHLIKNPAATFFVRVSGESMLGAGIHHDDILIIDRSIEAKSGKIVVVAVDGNLTVKRLVKTGKKILLVPENEGFETIDISERSDVHVWGVVTSAIHSL
jgi:DNA polymerase V